MIAASSPDRTVDFGALGPIGRSATEVRFFHFATVFWLMPCRSASPAIPSSLDYVVLRHGLPLSCGAAVKGLAHNGFFHPWENNAPSKPGIIQGVK
jgi:hypothetical protein